MPLSLPLPLLLHRNDAVRHSGEGGDGVGAREWQLELDGRGGGRSGNARCAALLRPWRAETTKKKIVWSWIGEVVVVVLAECSERGNVHKRLPQSLPALFCHLTGLLCICCACCGSN